MTAGCDRDRLAGAGIAWSVHGSDRSVRSAAPVDEHSPFAERSADDAGNASLFVEVRRVDNGDVDRHREIAKLVEHTNGCVMAAANDGHDDEQVDVRVGAVIPTRYRAVQHDAAGIAPLDDPIGHP